VLLLALGVLAGGCDEPPPLAADAAVRPAAAGSGPALAKVLLFQGEVRLEAANGHAFAARPDAPLITGDAIVLGPDSFVILQLGNGLLSRLDAAGRYPVAELAGLDAPAAERSIQQQLTALLEPDEKRHSERIVGWHARMAAGEGVAVQSAEQAEARARRRQEPAAADFEADRIGAEPEHEARPPAPSTAAAEKKMRRPAGAAKAERKAVEPKAGVAQATPSPPARRDADVRLREGDAAGERETRGEDEPGPLFRGGADAAGDAAGEADGGGQGLEAAAVEKPADATRGAPGSRLLTIRGAAAGEPIAIDEATRSYFAARIRDLGDCRRLLAERSTETVWLIVVVEDRRVRRVTASNDQRLARCLTERWRGEPAPAGLADGRYTLQVRWP
jgi:hypothetical protein